MRRITSVVALGALAVTSAIGTTFETARAAGSADGADDTVSVAELDLSGIDTSALDALPESAPLPVEETDPGVVTQSPEPTTPPQAPTPVPESPSGTIDESQASTGPADAGAATFVTAAAWTPASATADTGAAQSEATTPDPDVLTGELSTAPFSVLGLTWDASAELVEPVVRYRVRQDGVWTDWAAVGSSDVAPDPGGADDLAAGGARSGTDPVVAVDADGLQVWAQASEGRVTGLKAVLVDPGEAPEDPAAGGPPSDAEAGGPPASAAVEDASTSTEAVIHDAGLRTAPAPGPAIITRAQWGADESLRTCSADLSTRTQAAAVHHTASSNAYGPEDVAGIIRGFYAYHTRPEADGGRGWCDLGYNFLVDKFGRVFEGRAGSITMSVIGVHTGGFNSRTIGVAAIGEYGSAAPTPALLESLSQVISWKFRTHRILAGSTVTMVSGGGASKYPEGTVVTFPTIYSHRDAQLTSCPGQGLFDAMPYIRARAAELTNAAVHASPLWSLDSFRGTSAGIQVGGWTLDPESTASLRVTVTIDGVPHALAADIDRPDLAAHFPGSGTRHGFSAVIPAGAGAHQVCVSAENVGAGNDVLFGCDWKTVSNAEPIGALDSVTATDSSIRVTGWVLDPDVTGPVTVHVYLRDSLQSTTANGYRPDVGAVWGRGDNHGFDATFPASAGRHDVCAYGINQPTGINAFLGCRTVEVGRPPVGAMDSVQVSPTGVTLSGWAFDPDSTSAIGVHVYVDGGWGGATTTSLPRPDVNAAYGVTGNRGFTLTLPLTPGAHRVCAYAIDTNGGVNPEITCRMVTVRNAPPVGSLDSAVGVAGGIQLTGWAVDPDTDAPIGVHVYVDGGWGTAVTASAPRPDVGAALGRGDAHGFSVLVPAAAGSHRVCGYAIDSSGGMNPELACRVVRVP